MFKEKYNKAMNGIKPSEQEIDNAVSNALNAEKPKHNIKNTLRIAAIACVLIALICTSVFSVFKISKGNENFTSDIYDNNGNESNSTDTNKTQDFLLAQGFKYAEDYEEILEYLKNAEEDDYLYDSEFDEIFEEEIAGDNADGSPDAVIPEPDGSQGESNQRPEHSETNNQVAGVQEGDIVKTDGHYIYHYSAVDEKIYISAVDNGSTNVVSTIEISSIDESNITARELLLIGEKLVIVGRSQGNTVCVYYDISDRENPVYTDKTTQSGVYQNCRVVNGIVYLISQKYSYYHYEEIWIDDNTVGEIEEVAPEIDIGYAEPGYVGDDYDYNGDSVVDSDFDNDANDDIIPKVDGEEIPFRDILLSEDCSNSFTVITAYDAVNGERKSNLALLGSCVEMYCSKDNIYITSFDENIGKIFTYQYTRILRIALNNGMLEANGAGYVEGTINNQFSMDEKDGILRIATTINPVKAIDRGDWVQVEFEDSYSKVFCLDKDLKVIGESDKLGVTENIKSVRFLGDVAYVVTFRQTDPLYAIDLTDPENPKTLSELKIDGFSTYMQPYGSDYMLGIGYDADPETGWTQGIKLTMFDIKDPTKVFDVSTISYLWDKDGFTDSEALSNHKAILIDYNKGIIAIPIVTEKYAASNDWIYEDRITIKYVLYNFDGEKLTEAGSFECPNTEKYVFWSGMRALYIENYLYAIFDNGIVSVNLNDYNEVQENIYNS